MWFIYDQIMLKPQERVIARPGIPLLPTVISCRVGISEMLQCQHLCSFLIITLMGVLKFSYGVPTMTITEFLFAKLCYNFCLFFGCKWFLVSVQKTVWWRTDVNVVGVDLFYFQFFCCVCLRFSYEQCMLAYGLNYCFS